MYTATAADGNALLLSNYTKYTVMVKSLVKWLQITIITNNWV